MNGQGFRLRPEAGRFILTYFLREFEWTPALTGKPNTGNSASERSFLEISWELGVGGREACPQTTLGSSRLRHSQGALRHQKMSRQVLSEICPLLYKTVENPECYEHSSSEPFQRLSYRQRFSTARTRCIKVIDHDRKQPRAKFGSPEDPGGDGPLKFFVSNVFSFSWDIKWS